MQVTIDLPDMLTDKILDKWGDLLQRILTNLVLDAFRDRLINFDELKELLAFYPDSRLKELLKQENILHPGGILNLYGACADSDLAIDDLGISPETDDDLIG
jgi:hypothetical protein